MNEHLPPLSTFMIVLRTESIDLNLTASPAVLVELDGPPFAFPLPPLSVPSGDVLYVQQFPILLICC